METPQAGGAHKQSKRALAPASVAVALAIVIAASAVIGSQTLKHGTATASVASGAATPNPTITLRCGTDTTPDCPTAPPDPNADWLSIPADTPATVLTTFVQSQAIWQSYVIEHPGDVVRWDFSRPDTPVFVRDLRAPGDRVFPDMWVLPFDLPDGRIGFYGFCDINAAHTAIRVENVFPLGTPRPHGQLAVYTRAQALSRVEALSQVALRPGAQPYLVYAPIDAGLVETGQAIWPQSTGGAPGAPLWLVPGADGKDRVLGDDGRVYFPWQIPVVKAG